MYICLCVCVSAVCFVSVVRGVGGVRGGLGVRAVCVCLHVCVRAFVFVCCVGVWCVQKHVTDAFVLLHQQEDIGFREKCCASVCIPQCPFCFTQH